MLGIMVRGVNRVQSALNARRGSTLPKGAVLVTWSVLLGPKLLEKNAPHVSLECTKMNTAFSLANHAGREPFLRTRDLLHAQSVPKISSRSWRSNPLNVNPALSGSISTRILWVVSAVLGGT